MHGTQRRHITSLLLVGALALGLAGCGNDDGDGSDDPAAAEETAMDDDIDMEEDEEHTEFAFGEPANAADADRTIKVDANDDLSFDPPSIEVQAGETVTFVVTNTGQAVHEFTLGDEAVQDEHEEEMAEMMEEGEMTMGDEPNAVSVDPGETAELTWHFTSGGEILYGCHQPGHYAGGMVGTITIQG